MPRFRRLARDALRMHAQPSQPDECYEFEVRTGFAIAGTILLVSSLVACQRHSTSTQVVAEVNGHELTISELNQTLLSIRSDQAPTANDIAAAVKGLVDEELMAQAAVAAKLDQEQAVRAKLAAVRRSLLAGSLQQRVVFSSVKFSDQQLRAFYDEHPELFSERRIYRTVEFRTSGHPLAGAALDAVVQSRGAAEVRAQLSRAGYAVTETQSLNASEEISPEILSKLFSAQVGDTSIEVASGGSARIICLVDELSAPVRFAQSKDAIGHYLNGKKKREDLHLYLESLRQTAKIEYGKSAASVD